MYISFAIKNCVNTIVHNPGNKNNGALTLCDFVKQFFLCQRMLSNDVMLKVLCEMSPRFIAVTVIAVCKHCPSEEEFRFMIV